MTIQNLQQAMSDCDTGNIPFNLGHVRSFLNNNKWYPLRAVLNHASVLAAEPGDLTSDKALVSLMYLGVWTRVTDIDYNANFPVAVDPAAITLETRKLINVLHSLTN